jgi:methyl-accepting chemotaxis protein
VQQTEHAFTNIIQNVSKINDRISLVKGAINRVETANEDLSEKLFEVSAISEESVATSEQVSASSIHQKEAIHQVNLAANELQEIAFALQTEVDQFHLGEETAAEGFEETASIDELEQTFLEAASALENETHDTDIEMNEHVDLAASDKQEHESTQSKLNN